MDVYVGRPRLAYQVTAFPNQVSLTMGLLVVPLLYLLAVTTFARPHDLDTQALSERASTAPSLRVDLGYEIYEGYYNASFSLNTWLGIRYAAPPLGENRWRAPQQPEANRDQVVQADAFPPRCPQGPQAPIAANYNYTGDENCLFLSVYAPANATNLPVLVGP